MNPLSCVMTVVSVVERIVRMIIIDITVNREATFENSTRLRVSILLKTIKLPNLMNQ